MAVLLAEYPNAPLLNVIDVIGGVESLHVVNEPVPVAHPMPPGYTQAIVADIVFCWHTAEIIDGRLHVPVQVCSS